MRPSGAATARCSSIPRDTPGRSPTTRTGRSRPTAARDSAEAARAGVRQAHRRGGRGSTMRAMSSSGGFGDLFGDPDDLQRRLTEFAEQMQGQQRLAWADNAIKLAVDMTVAAVARVNVQGNAEQQAEQIRAVMARIFPEAVALVREAREGLS